MKKKPMHDKKRSSVIISSLEILYFVSKVSETKPEKILPKYKKCCNFEGFVFSEQELGTYILATNSNSCPILLDLYEECMSRTPTDYGAERCDPYRKMMASCGEIKRDPSLRRMAERHKRLSSKPTNPLVTLDGALYSDLTFHGKDMQPKKHKAIVPTSSHKKRACIKPIVDVEWEESQLREAIAKGFSNREEYWRHQSETDPKTCRITYELYEENFNAKISDFGLAKLGPSGGNSHVTTRIMGIYGHAAPEYIATGHLYVEQCVWFWCCAAGDIDSFDGYATSRRKMMRTILPLHMQDVVVCQFWGLVRVIEVVEVSVFIGFSTTQY
ncbi:putative serine/threonine-protein kinase PIX13 [Camellia lanceoleosa]|uniref:Serine/threonine-protein kinase PIX13 n=1 Tax=Camellia lanceoleosa TaxID=1840588 RepID=A0ACC0J5Q9_9ERIC|nr:putative serine/threonine-protein kinase PIX13 [Camellia lanceoleosa]